ncbi:MAG: NADH-quinone oxidoreductase subunit D [Fimbriimonadaceae bacterium]|nr:NADH-quinone oxidoreductase subunit D [Fimbriimonadaceae bacterium]
MTEQAVATPLDELLARCRAACGELLGEPVQRAAISECSVAASDLRRVAQWLRDEAGYNYLALIGGIDRLAQLEVVYLLDRLPAPTPTGRLALRVAVPREAAVVPTVSDLWPAADWHERECWDLLGVRFEGHPDLRRILLPEYWQGFPLRKDYVYDSNTMVDEILERELTPEEDHSAGAGDLPAIFTEGHRRDHDGLVTEDIAINMGPQHPSTHGVLRLRLSLDGEYVRNVDPDLGFLHRSFEKLAELKTYVNGIPLTDRWDYLDAMGNNLIHCLVTEQLMGLELPERAHWIRMLVLELNRLASHLVFVGTYGLDVGAATPFLHCFRDREMILDMFELLCGARLTYNYIRIGGVSADLPRNFLADRVESFLDYFPARLTEVDNLLTGNEVFRQRTIGVGVWSAADCIGYGLTGPLLRASGVRRDVRKAYPYARYDQLTFEVPVGERGDCMDRYLVRVAEMHQSISLLRQICAWFREHDAATRGDFQGRLPKSIKPPASETYTAIETPRGELGIWMVSDGSEQPYRCKIRRPSFCNLSLFPKVGSDQKVADLIAILGTTDIVMGEVDG